MIGLIGISHQTASQDDRGHFALTPSEVVSLVDDWIAMGYVRGAVVLSTCNRVEIYCELMKPSPQAMNSLLDSWLTHLELRGKMRSRVLRLWGGEVYRHLFRLSAGLESMVLGETQILGQVKDAYRLAVGQGQSTPMLSRLFHKAFEVAKRIRSRYMLSVVPLSAASRAVDLVYEHRGGGLNGCSVLIVGAGQMAEATLAHIRYKGGVGQLALYNRTRERAEKLLAEAPDIDIYSGDELGEVIKQADIIFVTTSASSPIVTVEHLSDRESEVTIFDMAVPRNVCFEVATLPHVRLFAIDDLAQMDERTLEDQLLAEADVLVEEGVTEFMSWLDASQVRQVIGVIQQAAERLLAAELALLPRELNEEQKAFVVRHIEHLNTTYTTALASSLRELSEGGQLRQIEPIGKLFQHISQKLER